MFALVKNETVTNPMTQETSDVEVIKLFAPHTIWEDKNGTQYSPDHLISLTADQKQDMGIYDVAYASRPDDRFYSVVENLPEFDSVEKVVKITYTSTAKDLEDGEEVDGRAPAGLKTQWTNQFKATANSILSQTDWMLVRQIEREVAVPAATVTYRAAVVDEANRLETAITAATTVEELITAIETADFPSAE
jgi:hypothetical protein